MRIFLKELDHKLNLFKWMTLRLLAHKYAYYILSTNYIKDATYDLEEKNWFRFGRELGLLAEDETSPCIDFNFNHPLAKDAEILAKYLVKPTYDCVYRIILHKYKQFPEYWM